MDEFTKTRGNSAGPSIDAAAVPQLNITAKLIAMKMTERGIKRLLKTWMLTTTP
jgi:hypothetical protein